MTTQRPKHTVVPALSAALLAAVLLTGCSSVPKYDFSESPAALPTDPHPLRNLAMLQGDSGAPLSWGDLMAAVEWADVVMLGEQHDDATGHAVQLAIVQDALARWPGENAVSMEMLERDEQPAVDDYLAGEIDVETFVKRTSTLQEDGELKTWDGWSEWYQPVIDAAKDAGAPVVAANAPRRYLSLARTDGYEALDALPMDERFFVAHPGRIYRSGPYRDRFYGLMSQPMGDAGGPHGGGMSDEMIESIFRSQLVWDATMGESIVVAVKRRAPRVIHLVGQFHVEDEGGTVVEVRKAIPGAKILVISMQRRDDRWLNDEDRGKGDIVIYTGARPVEEEEEGEEETEDEEDAAEESDDETAEEDESEDEEREHGVRLIFRSPENQPDTFSDFSDLF